MMECFLTFHRTVIVTLNLLSIKVNSDVCSTKCVLKIFPKNPFHCLKTHHNLIFVKIRQCQETSQESCSIQALKITIKSKVAKNFAHVVQKAVQKLLIIVLSCSICFAFINKCVRPYFAKPNFIW